MTCVDVGSGERIAFMPRLRKAVIGIDFALIARDRGLVVGGEFCCPRCGETVDAHDDERKPSRHFEHRTGNENCPYSYNYKRKLATK